MEIELRGAAGSMHKDPARVTSSFRGMLPKNWDLLASPVLRGSPKRNFLAESNRIFGERPRKGRALKVAEDS